MLISINLTNAICEQFGQEVYNAHLYLSFCAFLRTKGLNNIAKIFEEQYKEEIGHSMEWFNLLTDLNADVYIPEITRTGGSVSTIMDIASFYLEREVYTTGNLQALKLMAVEEGNAVVEEKVREMISKQQAELEEASSFYDKASLLPEWWQIALWDKQ